MDILLDQNIVIFYLPDEKNRNNKNMTRFQLHVDKNKKVNKE